MDGSMECKLMWSLQCVYKYKVQFVLIGFLDGTCSFVGLLFCVFIPVIILNICE